MLRYTLVLCLLLLGCADECLHTNTFRRFVRKQGERMRGNLLCRDCGASVVSFSYVHPFNGPPGGLNGDDELVQIGGWIQEDPDTEHR